MTEKNKSAAAVLEYRLEQVEHRFDKFEESMDVRFNKFENKLDSLAANFITHKEAEAILRRTDIEHKGFDKRIKSLEAIVKWGSFTIIGAVLAALLSLVVPGVNA